MAFFSDCPCEFMFADILPPYPPSNPPSSSPTVPTASPQCKTFAQAVDNSFAKTVCNSFDISISQLPKPYLKGIELAIKISETEYQAGVQECKNILHGRLILSKGDSPIKLNDLRSKLQKIWNTSSSWNVVSLGNGF